MTPLRKQMIAAMRQRGFSVRTHKSYLAAVTDLARYYRRSPAQIVVSHFISVTWRQTVVLPEPTSPVDSIRI